MDCNKNNAVKLILTRTSHVKQSLLEDYTCWLVCERNENVTALTFAILFLICDIVNVVNVCHSHMLDIESGHRRKRKGAISRKIKTVIICLKTNFGLSSSLMLIPSAQI